MKSCKEQLTKQFEELEKNFQDYCADAEDIRNQEEIINDLQLKVQRKEKEWDVQSTILIKEKEKAIEAAKFATQKLVDTVQDFQNQVEAHQKVQRMLTALLREKDEKIKQAVIQVIFCCNFIKVRNAKHGNI